MGQEGFEAILQSWKVQGIICCKVDTNSTPKEGA